jgi:hypothetical protein
LLSVAIFSPIVYGIFSTMLYTVTMNPWKVVVRIPPNNAYSTSNNQMDGMAEQRLVTGPTPESRSDPAPGELSARRVNSNFLH